LAVWATLCLTYQNTTQGSFPTSDGQKQQESFELAIKQFAEVVTDVRTAITRLQDKQDFTWKVIGVVGSLILVTIGAIIGQFVHFHF
jgi:hypothetical protein